LAAFQLSVVIALISAFYAARGPEIVVQAPEQVLLYRDGEKDNAVLVIAARVVLINSASEHGEVLVSGTILPQRGGPEFKLGGIIRPVFTAAARAADECEVGSRCFELKGLSVAERIDDIVHLPGGSARADYLSFPLTTWNCAGRREECQRYSDFQAALSTLADRQFQPRLVLEFHGDGGRTITCETGQIDRKYLNTIGWQTLACDRKHVSPAPLL
jgi:hypothetical protein